VLYCQNSEMYGHMFDKMIFIVSCAPSGDVYVEPPEETEASRPLVSPGTMSIPPTLDFAAEESEQLEESVAPPQSRTSPPGPSRTANTRGRSSGSGLRRTATLNPLDQDRDLGLRGEQKALQTASHCVCRNRLITVVLPHQNGGSSGKLTLTRSVNALPKFRRGR